MPIKVHPYYHSNQKRLFDITLAIFLLVITLPILLIIYFLILLIAGTPTIFKQKRTGKNKKPFTMYKFRTMVKNASMLKKKYQKLNQAPGPMFKIFDDPRFVGIGKFLSSTGFDELPQLINILKGKMSFVGPRPLPVSESSQLPKNWNFRFKVKPGVFSKWTLDKSRHESLRRWKQLEVRTVKQGGAFFEIQLIIEIICQQIKATLLNLRHLLSKGKL